MVAKNGEYRILGLYSNAGNAIERPPSVEEEDVEAALLLLLDAPVAVPEALADAAAAQRRTYALRIILQSITTSLFLFDFSSTLFW